MHLSGSQELPAEFEHLDLALGVTEPREALRGFRVALGPGEVLCSPFLVANGRKDLGGLRAEA